MLKQRVISAVLLALVVVTAIFHPNPLWISLFFALILLIAISELTNLTLNQHKPVRFLLGLAMAGLFLWLQSHIDSRIVQYHAYTGLALWLLVLVSLLIYRYSGRWPLLMRSFAFALSSVMIWICIITLVFVHGFHPQGPWILIYLLTLVWVADIGAYFAGRRFGRHKLAPGISPGKTWEGVGGGVALNIVWISLVFYWVQGWGMAYIEFLLLGLLTSAISVVGDLYESILKREAGMKDSGRILPGHGGVLDRVDSVIAASPVYVSGLFLLGVA